MKDKDKIISDNEGFKDVLDLIDGGINENNNTNTTKQVLDDYEIFDFLEKEYKRLEKLDDLFGKKLQNQSQYPQIDKLIQKQIKERNNIREKVITISSEKNSIFYKNISDIFNQYFNKPK